MPPQVIWRCQYRPTSQVKTYLKAAFSGEDAAKPYEAKKDLKVLFECRPYELGWLLYAFASRAGKDMSSFSLACGVGAAAPGSSQKRK